MGGWDALNRVHKSHAHLRGKDLYMVVFHRPDQQPEYAQFE